MATDAEIIKMVMQIEGEAEVNKLKANIQFLRNDIVSLNQALATNSINQFQYTQQLAARAAGLIDASKQLDAAQKRLDGGGGGGFLKSIGGGGRRLTDLGRIADDLQYVGQNGQGLRPIINNLMELNPLIGLAAMGVDQFVRHWDTLRAKAERGLPEGMFKSLDLIMGTDAEGKAVARIQKERADAKKVAADFKEDAGVDKTTKALFGEALDAMSPEQRKVLIPGVAVGLQENMRRKNGIFLKNADATEEAEKWLAGAMRGDAEGIQGLLDNAPKDIRDIIEERMNAPADERDAAAFDRSNERWKEQEGLRDEQRKALGKKFEKDYKYGAYEMVAGPGKADLEYAKEQNKLDEKKAEGLVKDRSKARDQIRLAASLAKGGSMGYAVAKTTEEIEADLIKKGVPPDIARIEAQQRAEELGRGVGEMVANSAGLSKKGSEMFGMVDFIGQIQGAGTDKLDKANVHLEKLVNQAAETNKLLSGAMKVGP